MKSYEIWKLWTTTQCASICIQGSYLPEPPHSLRTGKEVQKQNYAIWLTFDESTHKEDWFIAFLTWISCMNFTPETIKLEALTFKKIRSGVAKQEDSSFAFMLLHNKS